MDNIVLHTYRTGEECRAELERLEAKGYVGISVKDIEAAARAFEAAHVCGEGRYADLTPLLALLSVNEQLCFAVEDLLLAAGENDVLLAREKWGKYARDCFPATVGDLRPLAEPLENEPIMQRRPLYVFKDRSTYDRIASIASEDETVWLFSLRGMVDSESAFAKALAKSGTVVYLDVTAGAALGNSRLAALDAIPLAAADLRVLVSEDRSQAVFDDFPTLFERICDVAELLPKQVGEQAARTAAGPVSVCDLDSCEFDAKMAVFERELTGHSNFKSHLRERLGSFRVAHELGDKKVFSMLLFGESGVGKTETARLLSSLISGGERYLAKINFEAYSSQDSLNSLIGSPAGYVGCEGGELNNKVEKAKVKVLLCDEFEKTKQDVRAFFLELLEDGSYTDRMGVEHDMDGYVIVFTSNVKNEKELREKIAPELLTRFDLICEFVSPSVEEKRAHASRYASTKLDQYSARLGEGKPEAFVPNLTDAQLRKWSLREIDREIVRQCSDALRPKAGVGRVDSNGYDESGRSCGSYDTGGVVPS